MSRLFWYMGSLHIGSEAELNEKKGLIMEKLRRQAERRMQGENDLRVRNDTGKEKKKKGNARCVTVLGTETNPSTSRVHV